MACDPRPGKAGAEAAGLVVAGIGGMSMTDFAEAAPETDCPAEDTNYGPVHEGVANVSACMRCAPTVV